MLFLIFSGFRVLKFAHFWDLWFLVVFRELKFGLFLVIFAFWHSCRRKMIVFFMENCKLEKKVSQGALLYSPSVWKPMSYNRWTVGVRSKRTYVSFLFRIPQKASHLHEISLALRWDLTYNRFYDIFRLFDIFQNFSFTTGETMRDYYL